MTPENRTQTGVGATACASASQKWKGTIALLISKPEMISRKATTTRPSGRVAGEVPADLRHVERPGAPVDQGDARQRQVGAHAVADGEVDRALDRPAFLRPVSGQGVGRHAHQLEPHEQVEDVAGEAETGHARQEDQHQDVVVVGDPLEIPPGKGHGRRHEDRGQAGQARAERSRLEVDPDRDAVGGPESGEPVNLSPRRAGRNMITIRMTATEAATVWPTASRTRRLPRSSGPAAEIAAAASSGTTTARASSWSMERAYPFSWTPVPGGPGCRTACGPGSRRKAAAR